MLKTYKISGSPSISYIFFANDCILVSRAAVHDAFHLRSIIDSYCMISSQIVNVYKCHIRLSLSSPPSIKSQTQNLLQVTLKEDIWNYLGVPVASSILCPSAFNALWDKVQEKVEVWKWRALSFVGRTALLHYIILSLPLYCMSFLHVPFSILSSLEKEFHAFFWSHSLDKRGFHLI